MKFRLLLLILLVLQGCATRSPYQEANDPLEPVNRGVYWFNDTLDRAVLKPVAQGYEKVVPARARSGVRNFFSNLREPINLVNNVLQGKPRRAVVDTMRFGFNTIFGVAGLMDVATDWELPPSNEDFGQTFAVWGFGEGWYLVLPLLGPSTVRDTAGLPPEWHMALLPKITEDNVKLAAYGLQIVSKRADLLSASKVLDTAALDEYLQVREAYRQKRWNQIHDGDPPEEDFFDDELLEEDLFEEELFEEEPPEGEPLDGTSLESEPFVEEPLE